MSGASIYTQDSPILPEKVTKATNERFLKLNEMKCVLSVKDIETIINDQEGDITFGKIENQKKFSNV